ncbi:MAG: hypothetical protein HUU20_01900 [Pirellulales bacterium]|nr:hypothetical protein [Pirellulales bacterium]
MWHFRCKNCTIREEEKCKECEIRRFLDDCREAMQLICWYRYEYHRANLGHQEMLAKLETIVIDVEENGRISQADREQFGEIERRVDGWLYQAI